MIQEITEKDLKQVAEIHKKFLPSILQYYPLSFIEKFYSYQLKDDNILIGYWSENELLGFAFGTYHVDETFNKLKNDHLLYFIWNSLKVLIFNPKLIFFFAAKLLKEQYVSACKVQFVYMALLEKAQGSGIGFLLTREFEKKLKTDYYELEVDEKNPALKFHLKNKCFVVNEYNNIIEKKFLLGKKLKNK